MVLVITADPETAIAAFFLLIPAFLTALDIAAYTLSTSVMFFSTTAFAGSESIP